MVAQLRSIRFNSAKVLRSSAAEPVHDLRVAALRAGWALKFFKKYLSADNTDRLRHKLARARRVMAQRRDWDIFSSRIKKDFQALNASASLKEKILKIIKVQEAKAHRDLVRMLRSYQYERMLRDLKQTASTETKKKLKLQNLFKGMLKGLPCAKASQKKAALRPSQLHKIRIAFKHLRYACELLADFYDKEKIQKLIQDITEIQDVLGEHQDAENTVRMLRHLKITEKPQRVEGLIKIERDHARNACKKFETASRGKQYRRILSTLVI